MDVHSAKQRSYNMSQIKSKDTYTEIKFRRFIWENGIRGYRVKNKIVGKPDLYFPKQKLAIFIDGCFWHKCPEDYIRPKTKKSFWDKKIEENIKRDKVVNSKLKREGTEVVRFWEHEIEKNTNNFLLKLKKKLKNQT